MSKTKIKGTINKPAFKIAALRQGAVKEENGLIFIEGYANTKNSPDRYGDIPSPLSGTLTGNACSVLPGRNLLPFRYRKVQYISSGSNPVRVLPFPESSDLSGFFLLHE